MSATEDFLWTSASLTILVLAILVWRWRWFLRLLFERWQQILRNKE
jgi:hypothetical protein